MLPFAFRGKLRFLDGETLLAFAGVLEPPFDSGLMWSTSCPLPTSLALRSNRRSFLRFALPDAEPVPLSPRFFWDAYSFA